jgi:cytochrome P450/NADPH-cytochrome P450 reductase
LEPVEPGELKGVHYAVFGCGDPNWATRIKKYLRFIDKKLTEKDSTGFLFVGRLESRLRKVA